MKCKINVLATLIDQDLETIQQDDFYNDGLNSHMVEHYAERGYHASRKGNVITLTRDYDGFTITRSFVVTFAPNSRVEEITSKPSVLYTPAFKHYYGIVKRCATIRADAIVNRINRRGL